MVFIMSSDYSCFNAPVDLSLSGSQVSPTHRPVSARYELSVVDFVVVTNMIGLFVIIPRM